MTTLNFLKQFHKYIYIYVCVCVCVCVCVVCSIYEERILNIIDSAYVDLS